MKLFSKTSASSSRIVNLRAEFELARERVRQQHLDQLVELGVPPDQLEIARQVIGVLSVMIDGPVFQPHEAGQAAFIVPVRHRDEFCLDWQDPEPITMAIGGSMLIDLVCVPLTRPDSWAVRLDLASVLGLMPLQSLRPEQVPIWRHPMAWIGGGCRGLVILDPRRHVIREVLMACTSGYLTDDEEHGRELDEIAKHPWPHPPCFVRRRT